MELQFEQQRRAFERIERLAKIFFSRSWINLPVTPRLIPLICGPTGAGKTQIVKALAASMDLPLLRLTYADWVPRSYRGEPTVPIILRFMANNARGIIHIDEIDKMTPSKGDQAFNDTIKIEVFNLLDRLIYPLGAPEKAHDFMIVASGTWQNLWEERTKSPIGFISNAGIGESNGVTIAQQTTIPPELMNRFNRELIGLQYPSGSEVVAAAEAIHAHFPEQPFEGENILTQYVESNRGCRWFEEYATCLLERSFDSSIGSCTGLIPNEPSREVSKVEEGTGDLAGALIAELEDEAYGYVEPSSLLPICLPLVTQALDRFQSFFDELPGYDDRVSRVLAARYPLLRKSPEHS